MFQDIAAKPNYFQFSMNYFIPCYSIILYSRKVIDHRLIDEGMKERKSNKIELNVNKKRENAKSRNFTCLRTSAPRSLASISSALNGGLHTESRCRTRQEIFAGGEADGEFVAGKLRAIPTTFPGSGDGKSTNSDAMESKIRKLILKIRNQNLFPAQKKKD